MPPYHVHQSSPVRAHSHGHAHPARHAGKLDSVESAFFGETDSQFSKGILSSDSDSRIRQCSKSVQTVESLTPKSESDEIGGRKSKSAGNATFRRFEFALVGLAPEMHSQFLG